MADPQLPTPKKPTFSEIVALKSLTRPDQPRAIQSYKGLPSISFSADEVYTFSQPYRFSLIGSFWNGRPSMKQLNVSFERIGFKVTPKIGHLDAQHILITFQNEDDYQRCFLRRSWVLHGYHMRVTKWTPDFDPNCDTPIVPVWVLIKGLPLFLHNRTALWDIAHMIGTPLRMDTATMQGLRPSVVRLCIEIDISTPRPSRLHVQGGQYEFYPTVEYEEVPEFCTDCRMLGHEITSCKGKSAHQDKQPVRVVKVGDGAKHNDKKQRWTPRKNPPVSKQIQSRSKDPYQVQAEQTVHNTAPPDDQNEPVATVEGAVDSHNIEIEALQPIDVTEKQDLAKLGASKEIDVEEADDMIAANVSDTEPTILERYNRFAEFMSALSPNDQHYANVIKEQVYQTVYNAWLGDLSINYQDVDPPRGVQSGEAARDSESDLIMQLTSQPAIVRRNRRPRSALPLPPPSSIVTHSCVQDPSSSNTHTTQ